MTLEELLKAQGLTDEQITAILAAMKENKIFTSSEENMDTRYTKLKGEHDTLTTQYGEATKLIEDLKKSNKGNEDLQGKVSAYEIQVADLQKELEKTKVESAIQVALLGAKALDVPYMTFKLKEKGEVTLDENGKIKGIDDMIAGLKTQFPTQFETKQHTKIEQIKLPTDLNHEHDNEPDTLAGALKAAYAEKNE